MSDTLPEIKTKGTAAPPRRRGIARWVVGSTIVLWVLFFALMLLILIGKSPNEDHGPSWLKQNLEWFPMLPGLVVAFLCSIFLHIANPEIFGIVFAGLEAFAWWRRITWLAWVLLAWLVVTFSIVAFFVLMGGT